MIQFAGESLSLVPAREEHRRYLGSTASHSVCDMVRSSGIPLDLVARAVHTMVDSLMPGMRVLVSERAPGVVHAWVCGEPGALFYVYVPKPLRGQGIAKLMIQEVCRSAAEER